jgi:hypothetical protein
LDEATQAKVRQAVIDAERAGARLRFTEFVISHVSSAFYREEAADARSPVRGPDLRRALDTAYRIRSNDVHALIDLPVEAWGWTGAADTVDVPSLGRILTLEGLSRLARHVVRSFVDEAPTDVDLDFDWRVAVPGQMTVTLAPEYWLWKADGLTTTSAPMYLDGLLGHMIDLNARGKTEIADLSAVLERVETMLPPLSATTPGRTELVAIYALWHRIVAPALRRPGANELLADHDAELATPSVTAFAVGLLTDALPDWTAEQYLGVAVTRYEERRKKKPRPLPQAVDASLMVIAAEKCAEAGMAEQASTLASWAIEELPGNPALQAWEASQTQTGFTESLDLRSLLFTGIDTAQPDPAQPDPAQPDPAQPDSHDSRRASL